MRYIHEPYDDTVFAKMLKLKAKLGLTWKQVIARGLKGGKDGNKKKL